MSLDRKTLTPSLGALVARRLSGELSDPTALELARQKDVVDELSEETVATVCRIARGDSDPRNGLTVLRLVLAGLEARMPDQGVDGAVWMALFTMVDLATAALGEAGDAQILQQAAEAGERLVTAAREAGEATAEGTALVLLGNLYSQPYLANRMIFDLQERDADWRRASRAAMIADRGLGAADDAIMPPLPDAVRQAATYFAAGADLLDGPERGFALYRLITARVALDALAGGAHEHGDPSLLALGHEAAGLLSGEAWLRDRLGVLELLASLGDSVKRDDLQPLLSRSPDDFVRLFGAGEAFDISWRIVKMTERHDPQTALGILESLDPLIDRIEDEESRLDQLLKECSLLWQAWAPIDADAFRRADMPAADELVAAALSDDALDPRQRAAALIAQAIKALEHGEAQRAIAALRAARDVAPLFTKHYDAPLTQLSGLLQLQLATRAPMDDPFGLVDLVESGLEDARRLRLKRMAWELLAALEVGLITTPALAPGMCQFLRRQSLPLQQDLGEDADTFVRRLALRTLAALVETELQPDADDLLLLGQIAKSLRFGVLLHTSDRWRRHLDDPVLDDLLHRLAMFDSGDAPSAGDDGNALFIEENMLTAYARPRRPLSGGSSARRKANLQERFDAALNAVMLRPAGDNITWLTAPDLPRLIDARTVVMDILIGMVTDGQMAIYTHLYTAESIEHTCVPTGLPLATAWLSNDDTELAITPLSPLIQSLRAAIVADPGLRDLSPGGAEVLTDLGETWFDEARRILDGLHNQGKDHLCVIPHGPLHFLPVHAIGGPDRPLCDDWIVTFAPSLQTLAVPRGLRTPSRLPARVASVFGLSFGQDTRGLAPIPDSLAEARTIGEVFGVEPPEEAQSTGSAFLGALVDSQYVHVSTHGQHNVAAPAFQCLYFTPDMFSAGRIDAHELLRLDLRNVLVLTMSACETSLGRFDEGDNLRGLPATLLLAGVRTIIGTLWPVAPEPSRTFFTSFYRHLRRPCQPLDAFAAAQRDTRAAHPQYRDWAAFTFTGRWE